VDGAGVRLVLRDTSYTPQVLFEPQRYLAVYNAIRRGAVALDPHITVRIWSLLVTF
jgi:hypothetical protein